MKNKLFNINAWFLLLALTVKPVLLFAMEEKDKGFGSGFKKGFFGSVPKKNKLLSVPVATASSAISEMVAISAPPVAEGKSTGECDSIWEDPQYQGADALNLIFSVLRDNIPLFDARNLEHLPRIQADIRELLENPGLSVEEYKRKLIGFYFFHMLLKENNAHAVIYGAASAFAKHPNYLMHHIPVQQLDHFIISAILNKRPISNGLVTRGSDRDKGQLISGLKLDPTANVEFNYYAENINGKKYYRLYLSGNSKYSSLGLLDDNPFFKGYHLTDIMAHAPCDKDMSHNDIKWEWTGFILNKDGSLLEDDGIVIMGGIGEVAKDTVQAFRYGLSPYVGQHRFKAVTPARGKDELHTAPYLELLVDIAGGFDKIKQQKLVFMPHPLVETAEPTVAQVTFLLPHLYEMQKEMLTIEGAAREELDAAIEYAESIIVDAEYAKKGTTKEVIEEQIRAEEERVLKEGSPEIIGEIDTKASELYISTESNPTYKRPARKKKWNQSSEKAKNDAIAILTEEKAKTKMKERAKEICTRHLEAIDKPHYSASKTKEIRDALLKDLESKGIIAITGKETQRGSHAAVEVSANDHSTKLGLVERNQKKGFGQKALKRIISSWMEEVSALFNESSARK